jgi:TolB-like protein
MCDEPFLLHCILFCSVFFTSQVFAYESMVSGIPALAGRLVEGFELGQQVTIGVVTTENRSGDPENDRLVIGLTSVLREEIAKYGGVALVEQDRLSQIFDAAIDQQSARFDLDSAVRIGRLVGAKFLVFSEIVDVGGSIRLSARTVNTETAEIVTIASTELSATERNTAEEVTAQPPYRLELGVHYEAFPSLPGHILSGTGGASFLFLESHKIRIDAILGSSFQFYDGDYYPPLAPTDPRYRVQISGLNYFAASFGATYGYAIGISESSILTWGCGQKLGLLLGGGSVCFRMTTE